MVNSTIFLVRHCEYENPRGILPGRLPLELSSSGLEQAHKMKEYFSDKHVETIYSSAVVRCKQTSEIISDNKIPVTYDKRLLEIFSAYQGYWNPDWTHFFIHREELGGESNLDINIRVLSFFQEVQTKNQNNIIICSHADPLYFIYLHCMDRPLIPEVKVGDKPEDPIDYQPKGSVRAVHFDENGRISVDPVIRF